MIRIIIPAYNEEEDIGRCVHGVDRALKERGYCLYIVNDGSKDKTLEIIRNLSKGFPIKIINHKKNLGVAGAFSSGLKRILKDGKSKDVVVIMEGDGTSDTRLLPKIVKEIEKGTDIVIASRYIKGGKYKNFPLKRLIFSRLANFIFSLLFPHPGVGDYTIFYRGYSYDILQKAYKKYEQGLITTKYFTANAEMLVKMLPLSSEIKEIPFTYDYGKKKGDSGMNISKNLWQYFKLIFSSLL